MSGIARFRRPAGDFRRVEDSPIFVLFHLVFERAVNDRYHDDSVILCPKTLCASLRTKQQNRSIMMLMQSVAKLSEETLSERRVKRRCKSLEKILCQRRSVKRL